MEPWLKRALDYSDHWLAHQMRTTAQPGCVIAVARRGRILFERAYGFADLDRREALTPRHPAGRRVPEPAIGPAIGGACGSPTIGS